MLKAGFFQLWDRPTGYYWKVFEVITLKSVIPESSCLFYSAVKIQQVEWLHLSETNAALTFRVQNWRFYCQNAPWTWQLNYFCDFEPFVEGYPSFSVYFTVFPVCLNVYRMCEECERFTQVSLPYPMHKACVMLQVKSKKSVNWRNKYGYWILLSNWVSFPFKKQPLVKKWYCITEKMGGDVVTITSWKQLLNSNEESKYDLNATETIIFQII